MRYLTQQSHKEIVENLNGGTREEKMIIAADVAAYLISFQRNPRNKKPKSIRAFRQDMIEGRWEYTGEPVNFRQDGSMCNAQNRMHALSETDLEFPFLCVFGVTERAVDVIDSGTKRSDADVLQMVLPDLKIAASSFACGAKYFLEARQLGGHFWGNSRGVKDVITKPVLVQFCQQNRDLCYEAAATASVTGVDELCFVSVVAYFYLWLSHCGYRSDDESANFFEVLADRADAVRSHPARRARDVLLRYSSQSARKSVRRNPRILAAILTRAYADYLRGVESDAKYKIPWGAKTAERFPRLPRKKTGRYGRWGE